MNQISEKVSESHRKQPNKRWIGSYTQRITASLQRWQLGRNNFQLRGNFPHTWIDDTLVRAVELLKDYHDTMHVVYEERDQARVRVQQLECVTDVQQAEIDELGDSLKTATEKLESTKNAVRFTPPTPLVSWSDWERLQKERDEARAASRGYLTNLENVRAILKNDEVQLALRREEIADLQKHLSESRDHLQALRKKVVEAVLNRAGFKDCI